MVLDAVSVVLFSPAAVTLVSVEVVISVVGVIPHWLQIAAVPKRIIVIRTEIIEYNLVFSF